MRRSLEDAVAPLIVAPFIVMSGLFLLALWQAGCTQDVVWPTVKRSIQADFPEVRQVPTDSLAAWLGDARARQPVLLDTRTPEEYAVSHLAGATRVDPDAKDLSFLDSLARDAPIVTYCSVGYRSSEIARRLQQQGFTNVANLEGSIFAWANEGRPVYRDGTPVREVHPYDALWGRLLDKQLRAYEPGGS